MTTPANQVIANIRAATEAINAVLTCGQVEQTEDTITKQKLADALKYFYTLKTAYAELDEARKGIYKHLDTLNKNTIPQMLEEYNMEDGVRIQVDDSIGYNFRVQTQYSAKQKDKEGLYNWLREQGDGELIQETVNASTLATYLKHKMLDEGIEAPDDLCELTTYNIVGMTKYTPK